MKKVPGHSFPCLRRTNHWFLWGPVVACYALIFTASSTDPSQFLPPWPFQGFDKILHFTEFALFGMITARALFWEEYFHHVRRTWWLIGLVGIFLGGAADEIHQYFVPTREISVIDWYFDALGGSFGMLVGWRIYLWRVRA